MKWFRRWKYFRDGIQLLRISEEYEKDADYHRHMKNYHETEERTCRNRAKMARLTAERLP